LLRSGRAWVKTRVPLKLDPTSGYRRKVGTDSGRNGWTIFSGRTRPPKIAFRDSGVTGTSVKLTGTVPRSERQTDTESLTSIFWHADGQRRVRLQWISMPRPSVFRFRWKVRVGNHHARFVSWTDTPITMFGSKRPHGSDLVDFSSIFPGEPRNSTDSLFKPELLLKIGESGGRAELLSSISFWKRSDLECGLRNESGKTPCAYFAILKSKKFSFFFEKKPSKKRLIPTCRNKVSSAGCVACGKRRQYIGAGDSSLGRCFFSHRLGITPA